MFPVFPNQISTKKVKHQMYGGYKQTGNDKNDIIFYKIILFSNETIRQLENLSICDSSVS
jgi:hypothetical protein